MDITYIDSMFVDCNEVLFELYKSKIRCHQASVFYIHKGFFVFVFLHLLGGITIFVLINLITPELGTPFLLCISGYAISFMIGFITRGAPGGIGVREFAFTQLFTPFIGAIYALEVILLFRIITILSDLMLFVIGKYFIGKSEKENFTYI